MPIVLDNVTENTTVSVPQPPVEKSVPLDTVVISNVQILLPPNDITQTRVVVQVERGYRDADDGGKFVRVQFSTVEVRGAELLSAMGALVTPGISHYDDFKRAIYGILQGRGDIPAGTLV